MPRRRPPYVLRCTVCGYEKKRAKGRPVKECPKCAAPLGAVRVGRDYQSASVPA